MDSKSIFDIKLPEIEDRNPYDIPIAHLVKSGDNSWRQVDGRRQSNTLLVNRIRQAIDEWRSDSYNGTSYVTKRLFDYWFNEDHLLKDGTPFKYYFCQREAIETIVYLYEVMKYKDTYELVKHFFQESKGQQIIGEPIELVTTSKDQRKLKRYVESAANYVEQDLPPEDLPRYAIKMATGSGKTVVMALVIVWSFLNRKFIKESNLADNFLIVAPNVIVYERLKTDFEDCKIFKNLPLIPPEWECNFDIKAILRDDSSKPTPNGNLFVTNIQQIYETDDEKTYYNPLEAMLGKSPSKDLDKAEPMLDRIKRVKNLMVLNDEAHHVHDDNLAWNQTLLSINDSLKTQGNNGLILWLDFSATPKNQNGTFFPWIIVDYPLAQATEDKIVKTPLIIHETDRKDPGKHKSDDAGDVYSEWITIATERWREHCRDYGRVGIKPILFIMAEDTKAADSVANRLKLEPEFRDDESILITINEKN